MRIPCAFASTGVAKAPAEKENETVAMASFERLKRWPRRACRCLQTDASADRTAYRVGERENLAPLQSFATDASARLDRKVAGNWKPAIAYESSHPAAVASANHSSDWLGAGGRPPPQHPPASRAF